MIKITLLFRHMLFGFLIIGLPVQAMDNAANDSKGYAIVALSAVAVGVTAYFVSKPYPRAQPNKQEEVDWVARLQLLEDDNQVLKESLVAQLRRLNQMDLNYATSQIQLKEALDKVTAADRKIAVLAIGLSNKMAAIQALLDRK